MKTIVAALLALLSAFAAHESFVEAAFVEPGSAAPLVQEGVAPASTEALPAADESAAAAQDTSAEEAALRAAEMLAAERARLAKMLAFDARLSFDGAGQAALESARSAPTTRARAAATFAAAASGDPRAAPLLEKLYGRSVGDEQLAALFGLAYVRPLPIATMLDTSRLVDPTFAPHLGAALVLSREPGVGDTLARFGGAGTPIGDAVGAARAYVAGEVPEPDRALFDFLRLRREAALRFGRVDGEPWGARRLRALETDEEWLFDVIVPLGATVDRPWTQDQLLAALIDDPRPSVLAAATRHLSEPLTQLVASNLWLPKDAEAWHHVLDAIEEQRAAAGFSLLLARATAVDVDLSVRQRAACILFAAGIAETSDEVVRAMLESPVAEERRMAVRAVGDSFVVDAPEFFDVYLADADARVRAAALVAVLLRAPGTAADSVRAGLIDDGDLRVVLVDELLRRSDVPVVAVYLALAVNLPGVPAASVTRARAVLLGLGVTEAGVQLRAELESGLDGEVGAFALQTLNAFDPSGTRELAFDALMYGEDPVFTHAAARLLIDMRHPVGLALLRRALWAREFATTQFAAGWIVQQEGLAALEREADAPPHDAGDAALRRLGLALGEWGGYGEVQRLARNRSLRDPLVQGAYVGALASRTR